MKEFALSTSTPARIVFVDTETTSLRPSRRAWDIALIVRDPGKRDVEYQWFVETRELQLASADPAALRIGRFVDRHPEYGGQRLYEDEEIGDLHSEAYALRLVERATRGAHLVAATPSFDAEVLAARMRAHGLVPSWHRHLIDVGTLAVGYLRGCTVWPDDQDATAADVLPWSTTQLGELLEVPTPPAKDRHTALGDARYARALFDAIMPGVAVDA